MASSTSGAMPLRPATPAPDRRLKRIVQAALAAQEDKADYQQKLRDALDKLDTDKLLEFITCENGLLSDAITWSKPAGLEVIIGRIPQEGADLFAGSELLHIAVKQANTTIPAKANTTSPAQQVLRILIQQRAKLRLNPYVRGGQAKQTALHVAASSGVMLLFTELRDQEREELIKQLRAIKSENEDTVLHTAASQRHIEIVELIIELADESKELVRAKDKGGNTALHVAMNGTDPEWENDKKKVVRYLVNHCPDILWETNNLGQPPLSFSHQNMRNERREQEIFPRSLDDSATGRGSIDRKDSFSKSLDEFLMAQICKHATTRHELKKAFFTKGIGEIQLYWDLAFLKSRKRFIAYVSGLNSLSIQFSTYMQAIELPELECTPDKPCHDPKARSHGEGCAVCVFGTLKRDHQDKYGRQVEYVHKIVVPDCLDHPHTNEEIENALAGLDVRVLDWRKKDISLMLLRKVARNVERLHLYSSGSTELLSYWTSYMGLYRFRKLQEVTITLLNGEFSEDSAKEVCVRYRERLENLSQHIEPMTFTVSEDRSSGEIEYKVGNCGCINKDEHVPRFEKDKIKVQPQATPKPRDEEDEPAEALDTPQSVLTKLDWITSFIWDVEHGPATFPEVKLLKDKRSRIKIAVLDTGVSTMAFSSWPDVDVYGESFMEDKVVNGDTQWHSPVNPHGTIIARIIHQMNPYCDFYAAKIQSEGNDGFEKLEASNGHDDKEERKYSASGVSFEAAIKAIEWAISKNVDIMCMSYTISETDAKDKSKVRKLEQAISNAARKNILIFCTTGDKGPGRDSKPASCKGAFAITSANLIDGEGIPNAEKDNTQFYLPGEGIRIEGLPTYHVPKGLFLTSGSSFATAVAVGLASLLLMCVRLVEADSSTPNDDRFETLKFYGSMEGVFEKMIGKSEKYVQPWLRLDGNQNMHTGREGIKRISKLLEDLGI